MLGNYTDADSGITRVGWIPIPAIRISGGTVDFAPGVYTLTWGMSISGSPTVTGDEVTFFNTSGTDAGRVSGPLYAAGDSDKRRGGQAERLAGQEQRGVVARVHLHAAPRRHRLSLPFSSPWVGCRPMDTHLRSRLRFTRREGVPEQETEPGTPVTGQIPVTTLRYRPITDQYTLFSPNLCERSYIDTTGRAQWPASTRPS